MLAQLRGEYEEAERRYRQSLEISERLGDQAGAATSQSQLGLLFAVQRRLPEAVTCHVLVLASRLATKSLQTALDARALLNLRTQLDKSRSKPRSAQLSTRRRRRISRRYWTTGPDPPVGPLSTVYRQDHSRRAGPPG